MKNKSVGRFQPAFLFAPLVISMVFYVKKEMDSMNRNLNAGAFWKRGKSRQKEASDDANTYFIYLPRQQ